MMVGDGSAVGEGDGLTVYSKVGVGSGDTDGVGVVANTGVVARIILKVMARV